MVLAQLEDVRNAQLYNVRCRVQGYLHGNGIAEQLPDAAVLAEVYTLAPSREELTRAFLQVPPFRCWPSLLSNSSNARS